MFSHKILSSDVQDSNFADSPRSARIGDLGAIPPEVAGSEWKVFRLVQIVNTGGMGANETVVRAADTTATLLAGTNNTREMTTSGLTAGDHQHDMLLVRNVDAVAGAAPEGEHGIIAQNSVTEIRLDRGYKLLSAAVAVDDTVRIRPRFKGVDAAAAGLLQNFLGITPVAVTEDFYTWLQVFGPVEVFHTTGVPTMDGACKLDSDGTGPGVTLDAATDNADLVVGYFLGDYRAGGERGLVTIHVDALYGSRGVNADQN